MHHVGRKKLGVTELNFLENAFLLHAFYYVNNSKMQEIMEIFHFENI
jgi:hypothetical protein